MKSKIITGCIMALFAIAAIAAPYIPPKVWVSGDPILSTDFNTMNATLANSINNITNAQITDSTITGGKLAAGTIGINNFTTAVSFVTLGAVTAYAGDTQTDTMTSLGWIICDGRSLSRTTYAALYGLLGTRYGAADVNTFKVPDLRARVVVGVNNNTISATAVEDTRSIRVLGDTGGVETHVLTDTEMPSHSHNLTVNNDDGLYAAYAGYSNTLATQKQTTESGGDAPHINMPPYIVMNYIIYAGR